MWPASLFICFLENDQKTEAGFTTDKPNFQHYYYISSDFFLLLNNLFPSYQQEDEYLIDLYNL